MSAAREFLAEKMRVLSETERATILRAMRILQRAVADAPDEERKKSRTT